MDPVARKRSGDEAGTAPPDALRRMLAAERRAIEARAAHLKVDFDDIVEASTGVALDDEHDPDGATVAFERALVSSLLGQAQRDLADLEEALDRLDAGSYGDCERCGRQILLERLRARPTTRTCVACAAATAEAPLRGR